MISGDQQDNPQYEDPRNQKETQNKNSDQGLQEVLKFYQKGEYFLTGAPTQDASDNYFKKYLAGEIEKKKKYLEGTLMGVFFPVMNNVFGVLLFIRQPSLTAEAGLGQMLLIVFICCCCTFSTSVSLGALCSNGRMATGGTYFLFSRALGAPLGTAIGFCFWIANTVAVAQYILGVSETWQNVGWPVPFDRVEGKLNNLRVIGTIIFLTLLTINLFGIKYVSRAGLLFLTLVIMGIVMVFIGIGIDKYSPKLQTATEVGFNGLSHEHCKANWDSKWIDKSFFQAMGIYFPAVTGILAGSNRSGDLKNPSDSIPKGTISAQIITSFVYLSLSVIYGCGADRTTLLREDVMVVVEASWPNRELMAIAMMMSSAGAAIENIAGAPRLLFAMATDGNLKFLNRFQGKFKLLMCVNGILSLGAIQIAKIDFINPINTMFFLVPYGILNFVTLFSDILKFPNWRPQYNYYNKGICLAGFLLSAVMAILISKWWCFGALTFQVIIYYYVKKNANLNQEAKERNSFGDLFDAFYMKIASTSIMKLIQSRSHVKNWIPSTLIIGDVTIEGKITNEGALKLLDAFKEDSCLNTYGFIHKSNLLKEDHLNLKKKEKLLKDYLEDKKYSILHKSIMIDHSKAKVSGISFLLQSAGMAGLEPNTILTGFPEGYRENPKKAENFLEIFQQSILLDKAVIVTKPDDAFISDIIYKGFIDIFSFSYEKGLMLMIPYFLKRSAQWAQCTLRLFIINLRVGDQQNDEEESKKISKEIQEFLVRYRLLKNITINCIFLSPQEIENFILQEYQMYMIQKKRQELITIDKSKSQKECESINSEKSDEKNKIDHITIALQQNDHKDSQSVQTNVEQLNYKAPEKFLSSTYSKGNSLNKLLLMHSKESDLTILNLPAPVNQDPVQYLDYLRVLTSGLKRVLFIKNESQEVITEFS